MSIHIGEPAKKAEKKYNTEFMIRFGGHKEWRSGGVEGGSRPAAVAEENKE